MAAIRTMRTTAFRLGDELLGEVYVWHASQAFADAWQQLTRARRPGPRKLPFSSLVAALRALSGDFVTLQEPRGHGDHVLISRRPIERQLLQDALAAWEVIALGESEPGALSGKLDGFWEAVFPVASVVQRRDNDCPLLVQGWAWEAARWEVAHRLLKEPLQTDAGPVALRLDSDAALLTWDAPVSGGDGKMQALHRVRPRVITVPGVNAPVIHLESGLVRLSTEWRGQRNAWADVAADRPLYYLTVGHKRVDGGYRPHWRDGAAELLRHLSLEPLPGLDQSPSFRGRLRAGFRWPPWTAPIGRGVGPWFHEYVACHAYAALGDAADPLIVERSVSSFPTRGRLTNRVKAEQFSTASLMLRVVYANAATRQRLVKSLPQFIRKHMFLPEPALEQAVRELSEIEDDATVRVGPINVQFVCPLQSEAHLLRKCDRSTLDKWLKGWLPNDVAPPPTALLIETVGGDDRKEMDRSNDPKYALRGLLAARGIVSQFIASDSAPLTPNGDGEDHAGMNALRDLLRSAGLFLWRFPSAGVEEGTVLVGIHCARVNRRSGVAGGYLPSLVAVSSGGAEALGYAASGGWQSLGLATAALLAQSPLGSQAEAKQYVQQAVAQLRVRSSNDPMILFFDAVGCRRLWSWLQDKGDQRPEHWATSEQTAIVRIRNTASEVPRLAGRNDWSDAPQPARYTPFCPVQMVGADGSSPTYIVAGSTTMDRNQDARKSTRYMASPGGLRGDWHSLSMTELLVLDPGPWEESAVLHQTFALCRGAPTWEQSLRWPAPLHLARAVVRDHPLWSEDDDLTEDEG